MMRKTSLVVIDNQKLLLVTQEKLNLHTRVMHQVVDTMKELKFHFAKYDRPETTDEQGINPVLNEALKRIPFDEDEEVKSFFNASESEKPEDVRERGLYLQRYILGTVNWTVASFCTRMVRKLCTKRYRREHFFPGFNTYTGVTYVPDQLARFMVTVANLAATHAGGFKLEKIMNQLRTQFYAKSISADKSGFHTTTDEEEEEDEEDLDKEDTTDKRGESGGSTTSTERLTRAQAKAKGSSRAVSEEQDEDVHKKTSYKGKGKGKGKKSKPLPQPDSSSGNEA